MVQSHRNLKTTHTQIEKLILFFQGFVHLADIPTESQHRTGSGSSLWRACMCVCMCVQTAVYYRSTIPVSLMFASVILIPQIPLLQLILQMGKIFQRMQISYTFRCFTRLAIQHHLCWQLGFWKIGASLVRASSCWLIHLTVPSIFCGGPILVILLTSANSNLEAIHRVNSTE